MIYANINRWGRNLVELAFSDGSSIVLSGKQSMEFQDWVSVVVDRGLSDWDQARGMVRK